MPELLPDSSIHSGGGSFTSSRILGERGSGLRAVHEDLAVLNAADHVHVEHGDGVLERQQRMIHIPVAAQQPQFLAREGQEQNSALLLRLLRKPARQFDHAGGAGSVIVGAGMHRADLRGRERMLVAQAQMIVVRADDHVLGGLARQVGRDIVNRLDLVHQIDGQIHLELWQERTSAASDLVDVLGDFAQVAAFGVQPRFGGSLLSLARRGCRRRWAAGGAEFLQLVLDPACAGASLTRITPRAPCIFAFTSCR